MNRQEWMVDLLDVRPGDRIFEIGCGGIAVSLVCGKLEGGCVTAIDRSEKMVRLSAEREFRRRPREDALLIQKVRT